MTPINSRLKLLKYIFSNLKKNKKRFKNRDFIYSKNKGYLSNSDVRVNDYIVSQIKKNFNKDLIISEEEINTYENLDFNKHIWVIDPICGTTNYVRDLELYSHSICILKNSKILGGVLNPNNGNFYYTNGKVSFLNEKKIKCSKTKNLDEAVLSINCNQSSKNSHKIKKLVNIFCPPVTRRLKIIESANLEMSFVASGVLDAYINPDDKVWDMLIGSELVKNAGGYFSYFEENKNNPIAIKGVVASNNYLYSKIIKIINEQL